MDTRVKEIQWAWYNPDVQDLLLKYYRDWLFNTPELADRMVEKILSITGIDPPSQVIDIGCGLGYHAIAFASRGFRVTAFDPGDRYVAIARENIAKAGADIDICRMKCCDVSDTERFSLAWAGGYCPGQLSQEEVLRDFSQIHNALRPGGWFVSNVAGKPKIPPMAKVRNWKELSDCYILTEKWADETYFHEHCWFVYPDGHEVVKLIEKERMYGLKEITPLLKEAGFKNINTAGRLLDTSIPARPGEHFTFWCQR